MSDVKQTSVTKRVLLTLAAPVIWICYKGPRAVIRMTHERHERSKATAKTWFGKQHILVKFLLAPIFAVTWWPAMFVWFLFHGGVGILKRNFYDFMRGTTIYNKQGMPVLIKFATYSSSVYLTTLTIYCYVVAGVETYSGNNAPWIALGFFGILGMSVLVIKTNIAWDVFAVILLVVCGLVAADYGQSVYFQNGGFFKWLGNEIVSREAFASPGFYRIVAEVLTVYIIAGLFYVAAYCRYSFDGNEIVRHRLGKSDARTPVYMRGISLIMPDIMEAAHGFAGIQLTTSGGYVAILRHIFGLSIWLRKPFLTLMNVASTTEMKAAAQGMERDQSIELTVQADVAQQLNTHKEMDLEGEGPVHSAQEVLGDSVVSVEGL